MTFSGTSHSILPDEACRLACDIAAVNMAVFDQSNSLKQANERWLRDHNLDMASAAGTPAMRCWPADDANERVSMINRARTTGVAILFHEQHDGRRVETAVVPLASADVMLLSSATGFDRSSWPTRLPQPELVGGAAEASNRVQSLSKREREVFGLLASGMTIKQVAESLGRSEKTIEGHRDSIYRKLNVSNRAEIAILAMEAGLMPARRSATMGG